MAVGAVLEINYGHQPWLKVSRAVVGTSRGLLDTAFSFKSTGTLEQCPFCVNLTEGGMSSVFQHRPPFFADRECHNGVCWY